MARVALWRARLPGRGLFEGALPGILVEFDAVEDAASAAAAALVEQGTILAGLLRMWIRCFRTGDDHVTRAQLAGFFRCSVTDLVIDALVTFRFLEAAGDGWRIKGARDRILRGKAARRAGGLAAAKHLIPGGPRARSSPAPAENQPSPPISDLGSSSAEPRLPADQHSAISIQPSAVKEDPPRRASRRRAAPPLALTLVEPPEAPAWKLLIERLCQVFSAAKGAAYDFGGRDAAALKQLVAKAGDEQIVAAWDRALRHAGFPAVATLWELVQHWNHFSGQKAPPAGAKHARAEHQNHAADEEF